jgi:hypothetical protein
MTATSDEPRLQLKRPPANKDELWETVGTMFNVWLPRQKVCPDHQAPFDAFADAYFGNENNWALWYGSRGTGKSYMLAILALTKAALLDVQVTLLGGSMAQSQNVHEHVENLMQSPLAPRYAVTGEKQTELAFMPGSWIRPLPASQKTVRGPHPHMTLLDEIDEMEKKVYDAAMGQALEKPNARGELVSEMVVASSTWQNPLGTFQEVFDSARIKGMPIFTWCYKEVLEPNGWMKPEFIERKRASVPAEMFRVEYELGEPSGDARAFDLQKVRDYFQPMQPVRQIHKANFDEWVYEEPQPGGWYAAGADWAKMQDKTVITVCRMDEGLPRRIVYIARINRRPWPEMISLFNDVVNRYHAVSAHDATGLGNVIVDLVDERSIKVELIQQKRTKLLTEYIANFESGYYIWPLNPPEHENGAWTSPAYEAHRATTVADVYGNQQILNAHLPDDVAAAAIMHRAAERAAPNAAAAGVPKSPEPPSMMKVFQAGPTEVTIIGPQGNVRVMDEGPADGVGVAWVADAKNSEWGVFNI